ncbi:unnamed protein product, partial [Nesidiocoris tenuis]
MIGIRSVGTGNRQQATYGKPGSRTRKCRWPPQLACRYVRMSSRAGFNVESARAGLSHLMTNAGTNGTVEGADIVEKEVFVYNLGTMFFVNRVIFGDEIPYDPNSPTPTTTDPSREPTTSMAEDIDVTTGTDILLDDVASTAMTVQPPVETTTQPSATEFTPSVVSSKK